MIDDAAWRAMTHLWEMKHPYYCSESNYFKNGVGMHYESWAEFHAAMGDADDDYNLVFRWAAVPCP